MSSITPSAVKVKGFDLESVYAGPARGSPGAGAVAEGIALEFDEIDDNLEISKFRVMSASEVAKDKTADEKLFDSLVRAKVLTAQVAMHLDHDWRNRLFAKLDSLLDAGDWHEDDEVMQNSSFATFLRTILYIHPKRIPSLGLSNQGYLIAAWISGKNRLILEFSPQDVIRWSVSCEIEGELERAAGEVPVRRLLAVISPYSPDRWFVDAADATATK
jgi:hypothetical protein